VQGITTEKMAKGKVARTSIWPLTTLKTSKELRDSCGHTDCSQPGGRMVEHPHLIEEPLWAFHRAGNNIHKAITAELVMIFMRL